MIITISGRQGAGKTTIAKELAKKLNYKFISIGDLQGDLAMEKGLTITEMMALEKKESWIHKAMDKKTEEIGKTKDNFIIDGWIAYHFIPHSFKIFLNVDSQIGAKRIFNDIREDEPHQETIEKTKENMEERLKDAQAGFKKAHNINFLDTSNYDLILDTSNLKKEEVINTILNHLNNLKI